MNNPSPNPSPNPNPIPSPTPSPLVPQGTLLDPKNVGRARVRLAVFFIISVHVIGLMALLMQGCRKPAETTETAGGDTNTMMPPTLDTNLPPVEPNVATASNTGVPPLMDNTAMPTAPGAGQEYTVLKGDSFYSIAKKFSVTMKAIQEANPTVQPTKLQPGQKLHIPAAVATPAVSTAVVVEANSGEITYTVKSGDTLTKIAVDHGTTVKAIRSANPTLTTDKIVVGQKLKIPAKAAAPAPAPAPAPAAPAPAPVH